jgi:hypothetical protein
VVVGISGCGSTFVVGEVSCNADSCEAGCAACKPLPSGKPALIKQSSKASSGSSSWAPVTRALNAAVASSIVVSSQTSNTLFVSVPIKSLAVSCARLKPPCGASTVAKSAHFRH